MVNVLKTSRRCMLKAIRFYGTDLNYLLIFRHIMKNNTDYILFVMFIRDVRIFRER